MFFFKCCNGSPALLLSLTPNCRAGYNSQFGGFVWVERDFLLVCDNNLESNMVCSKAYTTLVPKFEKHPLFADFGRKKHHFFNRNRWFWGPIKHPFLSKTRFFHNISSSTIFVKVRTCVTASNSRHFSMYVVFFITSKLWLKLKYTYASQIKHAEQTNGNKCMHNFTLFQNFADSCLQNDSFCWFCEFAPPIEKIYPTDFVQWSCRF